MLLDSAFLIQLAREVGAGTVGAAQQWLGSNRNRPLWTTVISLGEVAAGMRDNNAARFFLSRYRIANLHSQIGYRAAQLDRELMSRGQRLGENDNWIAAFALYYGEPILSNDSDFDRVPGLRRVTY